MPRHLSPQPDRSPVSGRGIFLMLVAAGGLAATLFWGQPQELSADTAETVSSPVGIRLQSPVFNAAGSAPASPQSAEAADREGTTIPGGGGISTAAEAAATRPAQRDHGRRYVTEDTQLQLVYKSLKPDLPQQEIRILPRQPHRSSREYRDATAAYRVSQSSSQSSSQRGSTTGLPATESATGRTSIADSAVNSEDNVLTLPAFTLPPLVESESGLLPKSPEGDPDTAAVNNLPVEAVPVNTVPVNTVPVNTVPAETAPLDAAPFGYTGPATTGNPTGPTALRGPDVLATIPRTISQGVPPSPPGVPVATPRLPALPQNSREVVPAPASATPPAPVVEDLPLPPRMGPQGYEPPPPGTQPAQPVPGLPSAVPPDETVLTPVPDPSLDGPSRASVDPAELSPGPPATITPGHSVPGHLAPGQSAHGQSAPGHAGPGQAIPAIEPPLFGHSFRQRQPGTSGFRATVEADADAWMEPYKSRVMATPDPTVSPVIPVVPDIPVEFRPWWSESVKGSLGIRHDSHPVDVSTLLQDAMVYSPQVIAIKAEPEVQYRVIAQEVARFDWTGFLETTYDDLNDPVGSDLATGNDEDRLLTRKVLGAGGFRRRTKEGGEFRFAQEIGHENQNSRFFVPNNQGSTRLELSYRQPLLDGAGRTYNESEIVLARIQANTSEDEVVSALQDHLTEVTEAYWTLYRARAEFFQRQKLLASAQDVLDRLEGRSKVDTIPRQVLRARAAVARARTRIQRTIARVKDAEAQLRLRVNSPYMLNGGQTELLPTEEPGFITESTDVQSILHTALANRPDISEAIRRMRAAGVRLGVSRNELLPRLDFLVETYVADLSGNSNVYRAFEGQFADNRPGYTLGLEFEVPLGNRAAQAKYEQRQWELKRAVNIFRATVEKSLTDVEIANREVQTAHSEILSRYQSMMAAERESRYLRDRFEVLPSAEDSATLLLEDLLDSFERLADEETSFVQAEIDHAIALINLRKEMGTLLRSRHSRPKLDGTQQAWVAERLQYSAEKQTAMDSDLTLPLFGEAKADDSAGSADSPVSTADRTDIDDPENGNVQIGYSVESTRRAAVRTPPRNVPIPLTPTTWRRLEPRR